MIDPDDVLGIGEHGRLLLGVRISDRGTCGVSGVVQTGIKMEAGGWIVSMSSYSSSVKGKHRGDQDSYFGDRKSKS